MAGADHPSDVNAREVFKEAYALFERAREFIMSPPKETADVEAQLRDLHTATRRPTMYDKPPLTSGEMNAFKSLSDPEGRPEVQEMPGLPRLQELMRAVRYPGKPDMQLLNGTGTFLLINKTRGDVFFTEDKGPIHNLPEQPDEGGVPRKPFSGGLADYALCKGLVEAALTATGREDGTGDQENNDWAVETTEATGIHMGGFTRVRPDGDVVHYCVSGAEMMPGAIATLNGSLSEQSQDGDYSCAGYLDYVVAKWGDQIASGEDITVEKAQAEIDDVFELFREVDEVNGIPLHWH